MVCLLTLAHVFSDHKLTTCFLMPLLESSRFGVHVEPEQVTCCTVTVVVYM